MDDLEVLCVWCHRKHHGIKAQKPNKYIPRRSQKDPRFIKLMLDSIERELKENLSNYARYSVLFRKKINLQNLLTRTEKLR